MTCSNPNCNNEMKPENKFCPACGTIASQNVSPAPPAPSSEPVTEAVTEAVNTESTVAIQKQRNRNGFYTDTTCCGTCSACCSVCSGTCYTSGSGCSCGSDCTCGTCYPYSSNCAYGSNRSYGIRAASCV
jgi:hypothetical protein